MRLIVSRVNSFFPIASSSGLNYTPTQCDSVERVQVLDEDKSDCESQLTIYCLSDLASYLKSLILRFPI